MCLQAKIYKLCLESARLVLKKDEKPDPAGPPKITAEQLDLHKKKFAVSSILRN